MKETKRLHSFLKKAKIVSKVKSNLQEFKNLCIDNGMIYVHTDTNKIITQNSISDNITCSVDLNDFIVAISDIDKVSLSFVDNKLIINNSTSLKTYENVDYKETTGDYKPLGIIRDEHIKDIKIASQFTFEDDIEPAFQYIMLSNNNIVATNKYVLYFRECERVVNTDVLINKHTYKCITEQCKLLQTDTYIKVIFSNGDVLYQEKVNVNYPKWQKIMLYDKAPDFEYRIQRTKLLSICKKIMQVTKSKDYLTTMDIENNCIFGVDVLGQETRLTLPKNKNSDNKYDIIHLNSEHLHDICKSCDDNIITLRCYNKQFQIEINNKYIMMLFNLSKNK